MHRHRSALLWSAHHEDTFAITAPDKLKLYNLNRKPSHADSQHQPADADETAQQSRDAPPELQLISCIADVAQLTCAAWSPTPSLPWTIAVGTGTGKVVLHDCTPAALRTAATSAEREYVPRHQRTCFAVAWNPEYTHQIAAGLDRDRRDHGVLVWDIEHDQPTGIAQGAVGQPQAPPPAHAAHTGAADSAAYGGYCSDFAACTAFDICVAGAVTSISAPN